MTAADDGFRARGEEGEVGRLRTLGGLVEDDAFESVVMDEELRFVESQRWISEFHAIGEKEEYFSAQKKRN